MNTFRMEYMRILAAIRHPLEDVRQHREIFNAILGHDAKAAEVLGRQHIMEIKEGIERSKRIAEFLAELGVE